MAAKKTSGEKKPDAIVSVGSVAQWNSWLSKHHSSPDSVMLKLGKGDKKNLSYAEALDVALIWGWIDSHKRTLDEDYWLQRFGPRRAKSLWSKINCAKVEALIAAKKMQPSGLLEVEKAKKDGRWERAYHGARTSEVPPDLEKALAKNATAKKFFEALDGSNRYAILHRVQTAVKPETRANRIATFVEMCAKGERLHEPRPARPTKTKKPAAS